MQRRLSLAASLVFALALGVLSPVLVAQGRVPPAQAKLDALLSTKALRQRQKIYDEIWKTYGSIGNRYWRARRLRESQHFFKECQELLPHTAWISTWLGGFLDKGGKGNKKTALSTTAHRSFQKHAEKARKAYIRGALRLGRFYCKQKDPSLQGRGLELYVLGLKKHGGPFPTDDPEPKIEKIKIPAATWKRLCEDHLVVIDGAYHVGTSLLKAAASKVGANLAVHEESTEQVAIQVVGKGEAAKQIARSILDELQRAYDQYEKFTGRRTSRQMRVFVFDSKSSYQEYCRNGPYPEHRQHVNSRGFANNREGFAVTYHDPENPNETLVLAIHEVAHLFRDDAFGGILMPSWYEEGFANYFVRKSGGKVEAGAMRPKFLARIRAAGDQLIPLAELLRGSAIDYVQRMAKDPKDARSRLFYPQSWALFAFFQQGAGSDQKKRLLDWETSLAADPYKKTPRGVVQRDGNDAALAFVDTYFKGQLAQLEKAYREWIAAQR